MKTITVFHMNTVRTAAFEFNF